MIYARSDLANPVLTCLSGQKGTDLFLICVTNNQQQNFNRKMMLTIFFYYIHIFLALTYLAVPFSVISVGHCHSL